jgi:hypothetical protein
LSRGRDRLAGAAESGPLFINPIGYAEVSVRFSRIEDLDDALGPEDFRRAPLPWTAAFLAGKAVLAYRRNQDTASTPLPDFFIGAHAAVQVSSCSRVIPLATGPTSPRCNRAPEI